MQLQDESFLSSNHSNPSDETSEQRMEGFRERDGAMRE